MLEEIGTDVRDSNLAEDFSSTGTVQQEQRMTSTPPQHPLDILYYRKPIRQHVREFAALMAILFLALAGYLAFQKRSFADAGALIVVALFITGVGYFAPTLLKPVWESWMKLAHLLGAVMSTLILSIFWFAMVIPVSAGLKLFRVQVMDMSFRQSKPSYYVNRDPKQNDFKRLELQY